MASDLLREQCKALREQRDEARKERADLEARLREAEAEADELKRKLDHSQFARREANKHRNDDVKEVQVEVARLKGLAKAVLQDTLRDAGGLLTANEVALVDALGDLEVSALIQEGEEAE